jgi:hypothetical protein
MQHKCRRRNLPRIAAEADDEAADEAGLAGAQRAIERDHIPRPQTAGHFACDGERLRFGGTFAREGQHSLDENR